MSLPQVEAAPPPGDLGLRQGLSLRGWPGLAYTCVKFMLGTNCVQKCRSCCDSRLKEFSRHFCLFPTHPPTTPRWALGERVCPVAGDSGYGSPGRSDTKVALDVSPFRQWGGIVAVGPSRAIKLCSYVINLGGSQAFSVLGVSGGYIYVAQSHIYTAIAVPAQPQPPLGLPISPYTLYLWMDVHVV